MRLRRWTVAAAGIAVAAACSAYSEDPADVSPPSHDREAAMLMSLGGASPGSDVKGYTMTVRGKDGGTGVAAIELVDLRPGP